METSSIQVETSESDSKNLLCVECNNLIGVRHRLESAEMWKCGAPENVLSREIDLVTGEGVMVLKIPFCRNQRIRGETNTSVVRNICGVEGSWFKEYEPPSYSVPSRVTPVKPVKDKSISAEDL